MTTTNKNILPILCLFLALMNQSEAAETVFVKYRGPVDLSKFSCESIVRSSLVQRVCYRSNANYMVINLAGTYYHYCRIDPATARQLLSASSMGRYFNQYIKGNFDCRLGGVPN